MHAISAVKGLVHDGGGRVWRKSQWGGMLVRMQAGRSGNVGCRERDGKRKGKIAIEIDRSRWWFFMYFYGDGVSFYDWVK